MSFLCPSDEWCADETYQALVRDCIDCLVATTGEAVGEGSTKALRRYLREVIVSSAQDYGDEFNSKCEELLRYERRDIAETDAYALPAALEAEDGCRIVVWQGDITTLRVGAIVNAGNDALLGCFQPSHVCVDNVIHSHAGPRLRGACADVMQGGRLPVGKVKVTPSFCLPCDFVLHTVGPQAHYKGHEQPKELASCYTNCLDLASAQGIRSVSFCCISTGLFGYPQDKAAAVAFRAVRLWLKENPGKMDVVVFNTFTDVDHELYSALVSSK